MHFHLFCFGWRIMPVHCLPTIMAKVSNEQRKEKEVKRQDWKGKRRARSQLLDQTFCSVGYCHHQWTERMCKGTEFIKVRSSESACNAGDPGSIPGSGRFPGEGIGYPLHYSSAYLVTQLVKNPPGMRETWVPSLVWEDPLEKGTATHSVFCSGEFHGLYSPWGRRVGQDWTTFTFKELRKSQRFRVSGRREVPVTAPETLGCWLIEDYAQWHVCISVILPYLWGILCISSSELKPRSFLWDKSLTRLS